jgi:2-phospho-L-lactate guanylyltransferase
MTESVRGCRSIPPVHGAVESHGRPRVGVLIPVKAFADAKQRLRPALDDAHRTNLARRCAERVVAAAGDVPTYVVCDDDGVAAWAATVGAQVVRCPDTGLNAAVERGLAALRDAGLDVAVIAHGDLPLAQDFGPLVLDGAITVVPDYRYDGTNVLVIPTALAGSFSFHYGRGSFRRHVVEAITHSGVVRVLRDADLALDLDTPSDLTDPRLEEVRTWLQTNPANQP